MPDGGRSGRPRAYARWGDPGLGGADSIRPAWLCGSTTRADGLWMADSPVPPRSYCRRHGWRICRLTVSSNGARKGLGLPKVTRELVAEGECFTVEFAIRTNGQSPAAHLLRGLQEGESDDQHASQLAPDEQIDVWAWFLEACDRIATWGDPPPGRTFNQLEGGIWELKRWAARVTFFDTDGSGADDPTIDYDSYAGFQQPRPWPDNFDDILRLATGFMKRSQKTPPREMNFAGLVRKEDLRHDRI